MLSRARAAIAPLYLFACLILGGSAQGIWQNAVLQLAGIAIIAVAAMATRDEALPRPAFQLLIMLALVILVIILQMLPVPASIWTHLGPRQEIAAGYPVLGMPIPAAPLSLTPALSLSSLLSIIPPLAIFCAMVRLKAYRSRFLAVALIAATVCGIILGALQVASSSAELSPWYLYEETNRGKAVGFFANADHMATLLLVTIPFLAAMIAAGRRSNMQRYSAIVAVSAAVAIVVVLGLALNGSLAGYGLALPVIAASVLVILPRTSRFRLWIIASAVVLVIGSVTALETTAIGARNVSQHATSAVQSRGEILSVTLRAIGDFMPFGSGLGSFENVYRLYEHPQQVTDIYVIHAHNDYAEVVLELGVAGILLIALFLVWWGVAVWRAWRTSGTGPFARAASIASAAILIHSLVDFPLRTTAIATCFAMCLAFLAESRATPPKESAELRRMRQVVIR